VRQPKEFVKKWGPAILASIQAMRLAIAAGRLLGIPLPSMPDVAPIGLQSASSCLGLDSYSAKIAEKSMSAMWNTVSGLGVKDGLQWADDAVRNGLQSDLSDDSVEAQRPFALAGEAYISIHNFLTTGDNATLGPLSNQLRGRMERCMGDDGAVDWVSVEGKAQWMDKHRVSNSGRQYPSGFGTTSAASICPTPPQRPAAVGSGGPCLPPMTTWLHDAMRYQSEADIRVCGRVLEMDGIHDESTLGRISFAHIEAILAREGMTKSGVIADLRVAHTNCAVLPWLRELLVDHHLADIVQCNDIFRKEGIVTKLVFDSFPFSEIRDDLHRGGMTKRGVLSSLERGHIHKDSATPGNGKSDGSRNADEATVHQLADRIHKMQMDMQSSVNGDATASERELAVVKRELQSLRSSFHSIFNPQDLGDGAKITSAMSTKEGVRVTAEMPHVEAQMRELMATIALMEERLNSVEEERAHSYNASKQHKTSTKRTRGDERCVVS
jgi:hypothetical protein